MSAGADAAAHARPAAWLLAPLRTSRWNALVARAGGGLVSDFALVDLKRAHWRDAALRPLLASGLLWMIAALALTWCAVALRPGSAGQARTYLAPLLALLVCAALLVDYRLGSIFGLLYAGTALIQSLLLRMPLAGMPYLPANGVAALVAAATAVSLLSFEPEARARRRPLSSRLRALVRAILLGALASAVFAGAVALTYSLLNPPALPGLCLALGLGAALASGLAAWWRTGQAGRTLLCAAGLGLCLGLLAFSLAAGSPAGHAGPYTLRDYTRDPLALGAASAFFSSSFSLTYVLARRNAGPLGSMLSGVLAGGLSWLAIDMLTHALPLAQLLRFFPLIAFAGILIVLTLTIGQWRPAQAAQVELLAGQLERIDDVDGVARAHDRILIGDLAQGSGTRLRSLALISQETALALAHTSTHATRLALSGVLLRLDDLSAELEGSRERYAGRIYPIALRWRALVAARLDELARSLQQDIANPYVVGVPLTAHDEIFVGRAAIAARLEQSLRAPHSPPLLLYGQRRMGKSSLLLNLARLLPANIVPLYVDGQALAGAAHYAEFLYHFAGQMARSARGQRALELPIPSLEQLTVTPFTAFSAWLDEVEALLVRREAVAVLALDEFEALMRLLGRRIDTADFTDLLRHLIQHRPRIKLLLAGSHTFEEFYPLAAALINLEVMKIGYLTPGEAHRLAEQPVKDFALAYAPEAAGTTVQLTRGHPYLLQLLCYELVWLKNDQPSERRFLAQPDDVAEAAARALTTGATFFAALETECADAGVLPLLQALAAAGPDGCALDAPLGAPRDAPREALDFLVQHDVIEAAGGVYRFQVELVRRWFARGR